MLKSIILGAIAGLCGTGLGALFALSATAKEKFNSLLLAVSGGVMSGIVFFDLIPEAFGLLNPLVVTAICLIGVAFIVLEEVLLSRKQKRIPDLQTKQINAYSVAIAIALHNLPEGILVGSADVIGKGIGVALLIALHNIPEGLALAVPLRINGVGKAKTLLIAVLAGAPTLVGAIIGNLLGGVNTLFVPIGIALSSGAMLAVVYTELLPGCYSNGKEISYGTVTLITAFVTFAVAFLIGNYL